MKKMNFLKKIMLLITLMFVVFAGGCASKDKENTETTTNSQEKVEP